MTAATSILIERRSAVVNSPCFNFACGNFYLVVGLFARHPFFGVIRQSTIGTNEIYGVD
jgi:hypothetical protein